MNNNEDVKEFHIAEILGAGTGYLYAKSLPVCGDNHPIQGMYEILNFMTDDDLWTHQLPRASKECRPLLLEQFPWLADIKPYPKADGWDAGWEVSYDALQEAINLYGEYHWVGRMHPEDHEYIDAVEEAKMLVPEDKIIIWDDDFFGDDDDIDLGDQE